jgi:ABC-type amino acid transport substrate-binding protein
MQELIDNGTYAEIFNKYGLGQYVVPLAQINAATS